MKFRRLISILVTLALILTILPAAAFADEETPGASPSATATTSEGPSAPPSEEPSAPPSEEPSASPSEEPSAPPSEEPSASPSDEPSTPPSEEPSASPSEEPSASPSEEPSASPSGEPSASPSEEPSASPSGEPSASPLAEPSASPSEQPSALLMQSMAMQPMAMKTITLKLEGGKINDSTVDYYITVTKNTNLNAADVPTATRRGYTFDRWYYWGGFLGLEKKTVGFPYKVSDDKNWYADWDVNSYPLTITAGPHGSITTRYLLQDNYDFGDTANLWWAGADADSNYDFDYWLDNETGLPVSGTQITIDENNSYTAIFKGESKHLHTAAEANGTLGNDLDGFYEYGSQVNLMNANPTATTTGYEFKYWEEATGSWPNWVWKQTNSVITVGVLNEYRAVFGLQQFTVSWKFGNGTPDKTVTADYGSNISGQKPADPSMNGYMFAGWVYDTGSEADLSSLTHNMIITAAYNQLTVSGVTVAGFDVPYDGMQYSVSVSGQLPTDTVEYSTDGGATYSATNPSYKDVISGTVTVRVSRTDYLPYIGTATAQITKAPLAITANDDSVVYGSSVPTYTAGCIGFATGESLGNLTGSLAYDCAYTPSSAVGPYDITPKGVSSGNYEITFNKGTLTVAPATMTVPVTGYTNVYDGLDHSVSVGSLPGDTVTYSTDGGVTYTGVQPFYKNVTDAAGVTVWVKVERDNYDDYITSAIVKITKKPLTITANNFTVTYGDAVPSYTARYDGFVTGEGAGNLATPVSFDCAYTPASDVGNYSIRPYGAAAANYEISYTNGAVIVNEAGMTVPVTGYNDVYDGSDHSVTVSFQAGDTVTYSTDGGVTYTGVQPFYKNATAGETVYVKVERLNYTAYITSAVVIITPAPLTVTANDQTVTYGGSTPAYTARYSGFVGGETDITLDASSLAFDCTYAPGSPVNTYPITPKGLTWSNYQITYAQGTLTVDPAAQVLTVNGYNDVYDGSAHSVAVAGDLTGATVTYKTDPGGVYGSSMPTYTNVTPAAGETVYVQVERPNYVTYTGQAAVIITPAPLTVTAEDKNTVYGQAAPGFTATYSGFEGSDNETILGTASLNFDCDYPAVSKDAGNYPITPMGLSWSNYSITYVPGSLAVGLKDLTITAQDETITYGDAAPAYRINLTGLVTGDTVSDLTGTLGFDCLYVPGSPVNTYAITPKGLASGNYTITFNDGTLTVGKADLTVTADDKSVTYGDDAPVYTASYLGFKAGDDASDLGGTMVLDSGYASGSPVNTYPITADGYTSGNYTISYVPGTLSVNKVPLSITAADKSVTYGDAAPAYTVAYKGFVLGETSGSLTGTLATDCSYAAFSPVGTYSITPSGLSSGNYAIAYVPGTLTAGQAKLTVTAENKFVSIGDAAPSFTASYSGFKGSEGVSSLGGALTFVCSYVPGNPVGTYPITPGGLTAANYAISFVPGTLAVSPLNQYSVLFVDYDGTLLKAETVSQNGNATPPADPDRLGYTFSGWQGSYTNVTANTTVTAGYTIQTFTLGVTIDGNGTVTGIGGTYNYGDVVDLGAATVTPADGYEFFGFEDADGNSITSVTITADTSVRAVFNEIAAVPLASAAPSPSPTQTTETINENETPEAAPEGEGQQGMPLWAWILIAAGAAGFLFWLFFWLRKKRNEEQNG